MHHFIVSVILFPFRRHSSAVARESHRMQDAHKRQCLLCGYVRVTLHVVYAPGAYRKTPHVTTPKAGTAPLGWLPAVTLLLSHIKRGQLSLLEWTSWKVEKPTSANVWQQVRIQQGGFGWKRLGRTAEADRNRTCFHSISSEHTSTDKATSHKVSDVRRERQLSNTTEDRVMEVKVQQRRKPAFFLTTNFAS